MNNFFSYRGDTHNNRIIPFDRERIVPNTVSSSLTNIGVNSVNETYAFLNAHSKHRQAVQQLAQLSDDAMEILEEKIVQKLEKHRMIDERCGEETDPCQTLPRNLIKGR